jgi:hypothetical protein
MLNIVKTIAQIAAGVAVGNVASEAMDKMVNGLKKVIESKKES